MWLLLFFVIATALNLTKAFHIDDAYHVQAAQWIAAHPLQPMSGTINWSGWVQHFYDGNQPPLFFYGLALWGSVFGFGEIAMHGFEALFTGVCIVLFYRLAVMFTKQHAVWLTGLLVLSPAFLVNQNVMVDVPLLACLLGFLHRLFAALQLRSVQKLVQASLVLTAGIFIKYTMLAVLPLLLFGTWRLGGRAWLALLVPSVALLGWSVWNLHEFGFIHLFGRSLSGFSGDGLGIRMVSYAMTLGAVAPWLLVGFLVQLSTKVHRMAAVALALGIGVVVCAWAGVLGPAFIERALLIGFMLNGTFGLVLMFIKIGGTDIHLRDVRYVLLLSAIALAGFVIVFAPWMATRHVVLVLPMLLLLAATGFARLQRSVRYALLMVTATMGIGLGVADRRVAAFYRDAARSIALQHQGHTIWYAGSMGWGYYAAQAGMEDFSSHEAAPFKPGDLIVQPMDFMVPGIPDHVRTVPVDTVVQVLDVRDRFCTRSWLRFYSARYPDLPWTIYEGWPERLLVVRALTL
jgi:hypothetical protein